MYIRVDIAELESNIMLLEEQRRQVLKLQEHLKRAQRSSTNSSFYYRKAMDCVNQLYRVSNGVCNAMREGADTFAVCASTISIQITEAHEILSTLDS